MGSGGKMKVNWLLNADENGILLYIFPVWTLFYHPLSEDLIL